MFCARCGQQIPDATKIDQETGLYYLRARYYDPQTGRFLTEDPTGDPGEINLYSYVRNTPTNRIDPTGLRDVIVVIWNRNLSNGQAGHVMVMETDGKVIVNQFPDPLGTHGTNATYPDYKAARDSEGRDPDRVFKVYAPDDFDLNNAAKNRRNRKWWDWYPYEERDETNCVEAASGVLRAGGVPVCNCDWPGNLGDDLKKKSKQKLKPNQRWRVYALTVKDIPGAQH